MPSRHVPDHQISISMLQDDAPRALLTWYTPYCRLAKRIRLAGSTNSRVTNCCTSSVNEVAHESSRPPTGCVSESSLTQKNQWMVVTRGGHGINDIRRDLLSFSSISPSAGHPSSTVSTSSPTLSTPIWTQELTLERACRFHSLSLL